MINIVKFVTYRKSINNERRIHKTQALQTPTDAWLNLKQQFHMKELPLTVSAVG
jgi:plasmid maintenance system antidote protein VapI